MLAAGLSLVTLAGCGSSGDGASKQEEPTELCAAVERYDEAVRAGDRTAAADALAASVAGLPDEDQRNVEAYVLALRGAPASFPKPDEDGVSYSRTQGSFEAFVTERCGEGALTADGAAAADDETTTTMAGAMTSTTVSADDQGSGAAGSTGGQSTDSGGGSGSGSGSDSSGSGTGSGSSMTDAGNGSGGTGTGTGSGTDDGGSQSGDTTGPTG